MLTDKNFGKILSYFDRQFWSAKTDETNWNYYGRVLDWYFENSVYCIDHLSVEDYFDTNGGFEYRETELFLNQYGGIAGEKRLKLIQIVLNLIKASTVNQEQSQHIIKVITNVLSRDNVIVEIPKNGDITIRANDIIDSGSYCDIVRVSEGILRKELRGIYKNSETHQKRIKYEFENMQKLAACPQILNVFDYDAEAHAYHMEKADMNLVTYLEGEVELTFEERLKIVRDILKGMEFAHEKDIIHRDLHLGNVLKIQNDFVICDFGLSKDTSTIRSMKSSYTQKNNHLFVDPVGLTDFTLLDHKSDIYSIGKMMDYIFTYNASTTNHIFKTVVERCICRDKALRYGSVTEIIKDIEDILKAQTVEDDRMLLIQKICNNQYDALVHDYIIKLVVSDQLSKFIVANKLSAFWKLLLKFEAIYQLQILQSIDQGYVDATGYGGWSNYDIFASISYNVYLELSSHELKSIAKSILEGCAEVRYSAKKMLDTLLI